MGIGSPARGGRGFFKTVDLPTLLNQSPVVVLVERAKPATRRVSESITPPGKKDDPDKYPPFVFIQSHYRVVRQIKGPVPKTAAKKRPRSLAGQTIWVDPPGLAARRTLHRRHHLEGLHKSPLYLRYMAARPPRPGDNRRILFLRPTSDRGTPHHALAMVGAEESTASLKNVRKAIAAKKVRATSR